MYPKTAPSAVSGAESAARHMITRVEAARKSFGFIRSCDRSRDESWHWREPYLLGRAVPFLRLAGSHQKGCPSADLSLLEDLLQAHPRRPLPGQDVRSYVRKGDSLDEDHRARAVTQPQRKDLLVGGGVVPGASRGQVRERDEDRVARPGTLEHLGPGAWIRNWPPNGSSVASMRCRYWTISSFRSTSVRWATAYAVMARR